MRRLMSTAKTTMHPAASPQRNYMLDAPAAIRQQHHEQTCGRYSINSPARAVAIVHSVSGGIGATHGDAGFRRITLIRRLVDATSTRETICGANSDDIGRKNWVTWPSRAPTCRSEQVTNCSRYQLNSRIDNDRLPSLIGSRKSSAAANSQGVR